MTPPIAGQELSRFRLPVDASKAREMAQALRSGDDDWTSLGPDELQGKAVVPTFTVTSGFWQNRLALITDVLGLDLGRVLNGEQEWEFVRPIRVGETLQGVLRYGGCEIREGRRGGSMELHRLETSYEDAAGDVVLRETMVLLQTAETVR